MNKENSHNILLAPRGFLGSKSSHLLGDGLRIGRHSQRKSPGATAPFRAQLSPRATSELIHKKNVEIVCSSLFNIRHLVLSVQVAVN